MGELSDITILFNDILQQSGSVDIAEAEFKRMMHGSPEIKSLYKEWCELNGSSEKRGFLDYCEEYLDTQNSVWDSLSDYDDE